MNAQNNSSATLKTAELPLAVRTAPERIWLDLGVEEAEHINFADLEVTWSDDNATGHGIAYVLADTQAVEAQAAPAAVAVPASWVDSEGEKPNGRDDLERVLDEWNDATGALPRDSGWRCEVLGMLHDAYDLGAHQAAPALPATEDSSAGDLAAVQAAPMAAKFFSFDPADDLVFHETEDDARSTAQRAIDLYRDEAADGWSEEVERVCWGLVIQQSAENVLPDNFPPNAFAAGAAGSLPSVDYVLTPLYTAPQAQPAFQQRVQPWMMECFGAEHAADRKKRNQHFLEEALELVQSTGWTQSEAHQLVDYVYGRPAGEPAQEVGGVMVTLAALCLANHLDMHACGETELARIWSNVDNIRARQAAKPSFSPLPQAQPADALDAETIKNAARYDWIREQGMLADGWHPHFWLCVERLVGTKKGGQRADEAIDAAMAAAQEGGNAAKEA